MAAYLVIRSVQAATTLLLASIILFGMMRVLPGDPAAVVGGQDATPEEIEEIRERLGFSGPLPLQYVRWLGDLVRGDMGASLLGSRPVEERLGRALLPTVELAVASMLIALVFAVPLGVLAGARPGSIWDYGLTGFAALGLGIPGFYLGILAILLFAVELDWLPATGRVSFFDSPMQALEHLFLPAATLALASIAVFARFVRTAVRSSLQDDYVRTARAKGLKERRVVLRHVLPNSLIPLITVVALQAGRLLGGAVITEQVFAWPGLGKLTVDAVLQRDYLLIQGALVIFVITFVAVNFIADILYGYADPRVSFR